MLHRFSNIILSLFVALMVIIQPTGRTTARILVPFGGDKPTSEVQAGRIGSPTLEHREPPLAPPAIQDYPGWEPASLVLDFPLPKNASALPPQASEITNGWTTIMSEDFDGTFPNTLWSLVDGNGSTGGNIYWGRETYLYHTSPYSVWPAGTNGPNPATSGYTPELLAYMIYGPFSMSAAQGATLTFSYWNQSEPGDVLYAMVSTDPDGQNWSGWSNTVTNTEGWRSVTFDLASISGLTIANQDVVRIAFIFSSDEFNTTPDAEKGPFIDDVVLEKSSSPDLIAITPDDPVSPWDGPIIASIQQYTHISTTLFTHQNSYIDWAVMNQGAYSATVFTNCLYLADKLAACHDWAGLDTGDYMTFDDILINIPPPYGWITVKIVIDVNNTVEESDETNNTVERQFLWLRPETPDLLPHLPPGWSYPVMPASQTGTSTYSTLRSDLTTYIDWAVINQSNSTLEDDFDTCLYLDNEPLACWRVTSDLSAGMYYYKQDQQFSPPSAGQHSLALIADANNEIEEPNESNNLWQRKFTWYPTGYCGPFVAQPIELSIPIDGSWLAWDLSTPQVPDKSVVAKVSLKFALDHPAPEEVELALSHEGSPGRVRIDTTGLDLSNQHEVTATIKGFTGQPAAGSWTLWLRDPVPGRVGKLISASFSALSSLPGQPVSADEQSIPAAFRLSKDASLIPFPAASANPDSPVLATAPNLTHGWIQILYETFENEFPSSEGWVLEDRQATDGCQFLWDEDNADHAPTNGGLWAGWPANGGLNGWDPLDSFYPPNMDSWMIYGPFDLSDASDARLSYDLKRTIETIHDYLFVGVSADGYNFSGTAYSGTLDWMNMSRKLTEYAGDDSVWIGFRFVSDLSNQTYGPWIDNILVEKAGGLFCSNGLPAPSLAAQEELLDAYRVAHETTGVDLENEPYRISLQSRQFTPEPGLAQALQSHGNQNINERLHFLVQFYETPSSQKNAALAKDGLNLLHYLPDRTWIASADRQRLADLIKDPDIRWIGPLEPGDRASPLLVSPDMQALIQANPSEPIAIMVGLAADVPSADGQTLVKSLGGTVKSVIETINTLLVTIPAARWDELVRADEVIWIEPALPALAPLNDCVRERIGVNTLQGSPYGLDGAGVDLLVYDAATVFAGHPAFASRLVVGDNSAVGAESSEINHATHVAGTAAGSGYGSPINRDLKGMAPGARVISYGYQSLGGDTSQYLYTDPGDIENDWFNARVLYGADLGTSSIGTNVAANGYDCTWEGNYGTVSQLIDGIVRGSLGTPYITTWAAGNERSSGRGGYVYNTTPPPSNAKNPIHVGATTSDSDVITFFSSFGPSDDGRIKPTVVAPGDEQAGEGLIMSTWPPDTYYGMYGTSMATPAVAGLASLMIEQYRLVYHTSGTPLPSTIKALLIHTAADLGNPGPDYQYGYGRVDGEKAVYALTHGDFRENGFTIAGNVHEYTIVVGDEQPELRVSLAWDDAPASPAAFIQLVNNLDLTLTSPGGQIYRPFILNPSNPSGNATTGVDNLNNQEQIIVPNPAEGTWVVRVQSTALPVAPQTYSLVFQNAQTSNPVPVLDSLSPDQLFVGAINAKIILNGSGFINLSKIYWNNTVVDPSFVSFLSPNQLQLTVQQSWLGSVGDEYVKVVNPGPGGGESETKPIHVIVPLKTYLPLIRR